MASSRPRCWRRPARPTIVAPEHPAWFFYRAEVVSDEAELAPLWRLADNVFPPFESYRRSAGAAGRTIPILRLTAKAP